VEEGKKSGRRLQIQGGGTIDPRGWCVVFFQGPYNASGEVEGEVVIHKSDTPTGGGTVPEGLSLKKGIQRFAVR